jgi:hypothetical protein
VNRINIIVPGGRWKKLYNMLSQHSREGTVTNRIQFDATREIVHAMKDFKKETAIEIPDLLRPSDDAYPARRERLLEVISSSLERFVVSAVDDSDFSAIESKNLAEGVEQTCIIISAIYDHECYLKQFEV